MDSACNADIKIMLEKLLYGSFKLQYSIVKRVKPANHLDLSNRITISLITHGVSRKNLQANANNAI